MNHLLPNGITKYCYNNRIKLVFGAELGGLNIRIRLLSYWNVANPTISQIYVEIETKSRCLRLPSAEIFLHSQVLLKFNTKIFVMHAIMALINYIKYQLISRN